MVFLLHQTCGCASTLSFAFSFTEVESFLDLVGVCAGGSDLCAGGFDSLLCAGGSGVTRAFRCCANDFSFGLGRGLYFAAFLLQREVS